MMSLINQDFQGGCSEVVIIYLYRYIYNGIGGFTRLDHQTHTYFDDINVRVPWVLTTHQV